MDELDEAVPDPPTAMIASSSSQTPALLNNVASVLSNPSSLWMVSNKPFCASTGQMRAPGDPWFLISYSYQDLLKVLDGAEDSFRSREIEPGKLAGLCDA